MDNYSEEKRSKDCTEKLWAVGDSSCHICPNCSREESKQTGSSRGIRLRIPKGLAKSTHSDMDLI